MSTSNAPLYVIADIHGHRAETLQALRTAGLIDTRGDWSGGDARLWFLGDYVDRGPDGIAVLDDVRQLAGQAPAAGGHVGALLGNHEAQFLAAARFGDTPIEGWDQPGGFRGRWLRSGGRDEDMCGLTDAHRAWIRTLPAVALVDGYLLLHSDTVRYLEFGASVEAVNAAVARALDGDDAADWLDLCARLASRGSFRDPDASRADEAIDTLLGTSSSNTSAAAGGYVGLVPFTEAV
jgi:hypothetical protein